MNNPVLTDKLHYGGASGGGGYHHGGGGGYGSSNSYSSVGQSGYGGYGGGGGGGYDHHSSKGGGKKSIALSALTLLAFLFFLHILSACLEHMDPTVATTMAPNVVVMSPRKESRQNDIKKRKGDVDVLDEKTTNWEGVVTTRVKTFSKYDQPDHF